MAAEGKSQGSTTRPLRVNCPVLSLPAPLTSRRQSRVWTALTVMRFSVRVPVLSEQMTLAQPSVSTACSRRMRAPRLTIRRREGKRDRDDGGQALGDGGDGQRDAGEQHIEGVLAAQDAGDGDDAADDEAGHAR